MTSLFLPALKRSPSVLNVSPVPMREVSCPIVPLERPDDKPTGIDDKKAGAVCQSGKHLYVLIDGGIWQLKLEKTCGHRQGGVEEEPGVDADEDGGDGRDDESCGEGRLDGGPAGPGRARGGEPAGHPP